ncbi:MAG: patatin-like phospholipase family protein [Chloroflexi bacterium]|nr:patatin-like phospholipase family protein [Chloroflexota bacterium]MCI0832574.1 patatin-like phospholipase family protein [Chloroflexota bacterium]
MREAPLTLEEANPFQGLSPDELASVREKVQLRSFKPGDVLAEQGQDSPGLYVIRSGLAAVIVKDSGGQEREAFSLGKGECVGEMSLVSGEPCSATVRVTTDTETWLIKAGDFADLIERYPRLWRNLGRILSQKLARTTRQLTARPYANAVVLLMDCAEDEAAALGIAITASLARQTGKRTLLIDVRGNSACPAPKLAPGQSTRSLADVIRDPALLKEHEPAPDRANGLCGARLAGLYGEDGGDLGKDQILAALGQLLSLYDHVLLLASREASELEAALFQRARSILAVITRQEVSGVPSWLESLCQSPDAHERLEVAMVTGESAGSSLLGAVEERVGRPVRRLPIGVEHIQQMAREKAFLADASDQLPLREAVDRLARHVGEMEVGLALGGGAAKGFAHIGVLRVLEANRVPLDYLAGCSIGAIIGALYAARWPLPDIEKRLTGADRRITRWTLPFRSIWSDAGLKELLQAAGRKVRFRDLAIPFAAVATDIVTGRKVVLRKGLVWKAVQASASIPGIFPPVPILGRLLVDGGLVSPIPSHAVRDMGANIVVAVDLKSQAGQTTEDLSSLSGSGRASVTRTPNLLETLWRSTEIMQEEITALSAATADISIEPKLGRVRWSDFSQSVAQNFIAAGEEATREKLPELRRLLPFAISADEED